MAFSILGMSGEDVSGHRIQSGLKRRMYIGLTEPTALESACCKRADASLWFLFDLGYEW